jgi:tRNA nucleotidyltransferase (CCA-adding enzyme)
VCALVANHLIHHSGDHGSFSDTQVRRLSRRLAPATIEDLAVVMKADALGRPPKQSPEVIALIDALQAKAGALALVTSPPRPLVLGRHLVSLDLKPGPQFKLLLDEALEAQLDGRFHDEAGGVAWLRTRLERGNAPAP